MSLAVKEYHIKRVLIHLDFILIKRKYKYNMQIMYTCQFNGVSCHIVRKQKSTPSTLELTALHVVHSVPCLIISSTPASVADRSVFNLLAKKGESLLELRRSHVCKVNLPCYTR